jgi:hypothetical protein
VRRNDPRNVRFPPFAAPDDATQIQTRHVENAGTEDEAGSGHQVLGIQLYDQSLTIPDFTFECAPFQGLRLKDGVLVVLGIDPFGHADLTVRV